MKPPSRRHWSPKMVTMIHHQQRVDLWRVDLDLCDPDRIRLNNQRVTICFMMFYGRYNEAVYSIHGDTEIPS